MFFFLQFLDIDECQSPDSCGENALCQNVPGNYTCSCNEGFEGNPYERVSNYCNFLCIFFRKDERI